MKLKLPLEKSFGFTLIELLVVIAIMATLAAVIFPKVSNFGSDTVLKETAQAMVSSIRAAQAQAISGGVCGDQLNPTAKSYNWNFQAVGELLETNQYLYEPYCSILDSGSPPSPVVVPLTTFNYPSGIITDHITAYYYDVNATPESCDLNNSVEATFDNITGQVHFLDYYSPPTSGPKAYNPPSDAWYDHCDERTQHDGVPCGYHIPGPYVNCTFTDTFSKIEYVIKASTGHTYSIYVDKSGSVTTVQNF